MDASTAALLGITAYGGGKGLEENKEAQRLYEQQQAEKPQNKDVEKGPDTMPTHGLA
jgi:hypothetical protein